MQLTEHQQWIVGEWALRTPHILEVRLFGSRAKGTAKPDSDIDLAITVISPGTVLGNYFALGEHHNQTFAVYASQSHLHEERSMWKRLLFLGACIFVLAGIFGCSGSTYDDQPEMRLTDPNNPDRR